MKVKKIWPYNFETLILRIDTILYKVDLVVEGKRKKREEGRKR